MARPLMGVSNILQLQENGYKSTVSAISEVIDNSIQAGAKKIDVVLIQNVTNTRSSYIDEILILDNGSGMNEEVFNSALQMSSGTRGNARHGLGRYGQGLPNSSISQTKRVEVYTREEGCDLLYNYIDLEEMYRSGVAVLPDIEKINEIQVPIFKNKALTLPEKGTVVRWVKPNRVKPGTAKTLSEHLEKNLGRVYRYILKGFKDGDGHSYKTDINIIVYDFNGNLFTKNTHLSKVNIKPFDPMFLMTGTQTDSIVYGPTSKLYGEAIKDFEIDYNGMKVSTRAVLRVSYCEREFRKLEGRNTGATDLGKIYLRRNIVGGSGYNNVSIIRAGREIDCGSFGFIKDISDSRNRWWSAEVIIEPAVDSIVGIDNRKQQASNIRFIDESELADDSLHQILIWVSTFLSENIKGALKEVQRSENSKSKVTNKEGLIPDAVIEPGTPPLPTGEDENRDKENVRRELQDWIKKRYPESTLAELQNIVDHTLNIKESHIFVPSDLGDTDLYSYKVYGNKVLIEINFNHPFYDKFYRECMDKEDVKTLRAIRLLIGSMVNAEIKNQATDNNVVLDRKRVKNEMFITLQEYIDRMYGK